MTYGNPNPSHYETCTTCGGSGQDPRKRSRPCPEQGCINGQREHCDNCGSLEPCPGVPPLTHDGSIDDVLAVCQRSGPGDTRTGAEIFKKARRL